MGKGILVAASVLGVLSILLIVGSLLSGRRKPQRRAAITGSHPSVGHASYSGGYAPTPSGSYVAPAMHGYPPMPAAMPNQVAAPWVEPDPATEFMSVEDMLGGGRSHEQGPPPEDATQILDDAMLAAAGLEVAAQHDERDDEDERVEPTMLLSEDMLGLDPPTEPARLKPRLRPPAQTSPAPASPVAVSGVAAPRPAAAPASPAPPARPAASSSPSAGALPTPTRPAAGPSASSYQVAPPLARAASLPAGARPSGPAMRPPASTPASSAGVHVPARPGQADAFSPPDPEAFAKPRTREFSTPYVGEAAPASDADDDDDEPGTELVHQAELLRLMGKSSS